MLSPDAREQEYLLHAIEGAHGIGTQRELFLWSQGALQALLPHGVLLSIQLDEQGRARQVECLHSTVLAPSARALLCDPAQGPAPAWLRQWQQGGRQPLALQAGAMVPDAIIEAIVDVLMIGAVPNVCALHPRDWGALVSGKSAGSGDYLASPFLATAQQVWGVTLTPAVGVPQGKVIVADTRLALTVLMREEASIRISLPWPAATLGG